MKLCKTSSNCILVTKKKKDYKTKYNFSFRMSQINAPVVELYFDHHSATVELTNHSKIVALYPYSDKKIKLLFIYGDDYMLETGSPPLFHVVSSYWFIPFWFITSTILLQLLRRFMSKMGKSYISSSALDITTIFFGGGNLRYRHKVEKYYFQILLFGIFFLQSIWVGDFLSKISAVRNVNAIDSFEKLSELETPVYFAHILVADEKDYVTKVLE